MSYLLIRAAKAHKAYAAVLLRTVGLYPGQELLLMQLWDRDGQSQSDLVRSLQLDPSTVTRMVTRLVDQGVVTRAVSPTDGRAVVITLTTRGRQLHEDVRRVWNALERATTAELPDRARAELRSSLESILGSLAAAMLDSDGGSLRRRSRVR
ncbi:MAG: MarR family winged helix-turn-helix transcriptional regulator [Ilumatobacteraceae bacterium]